MKFLFWVESFWFFVCLILVLVIVIGFCIRKYKKVRKLGSCCGGSWICCYGRFSDEVEKDFFGSMLYSCVDFEVWIF